MPLTDVKIRNAKPSDKPIKLTDSNGLYLEVRPNGSKLWRYRYKIAGKENTFAIGDYPAVSLQEARQARDDARLLVKEGRHPAHARQAAVAAQVKDNKDTFKVVAEEWYSKNVGRWSERYAGDVKHYLESDVYPKIGNLPITAITTADMLNVIDSVLERGAKVVAGNVKMWCSNVFCYAAPKYKVSDPTYSIRRYIVRDETDNSDPLSVGDLSALKGRLEKYGGLKTTVLAIKILMHAFIRTVELRRGEWSQVRWDDDMWVLPAEAMKKRRTHIVPLSRQLKELLLELKEITGDGKFMLPSVSRKADVMSRATINKALDNMGMDNTGHDFRATASTHLYEMGWREEVVEMQLAHVERKKSKRAYNHAKYLDERRVMMQAWSDWLDAIPSLAGQKRKPRFRSASSRKRIPSSAAGETSPS